MQALSHFSYHNSNGEYLVCDLQGRADADFYAVGFGFITPRPLLRQLTNALPMHYKLDPKVIDASSVPSFDSLPIHHKIHPQLIDAYIASTKCVARLQRASVRGRFPNVHVFEIHRLVARWLSYSPAPTSTRCALDCDPRGGGTIPNCTPRALTRGGRPPDVCTWVCRATTQCFSPLQRCASRTTPSIRSWLLESTTRTARSRCWSSKLSSRWWLIWLLACGVWPRRSYDATLVVLARAQH